MSTQNSIYFAKTHLASLGVTNTQTKASWCLQKGLEHVCTVDGGKLAPLVQQHGAPGFYSCIGEGKKCRHDATQDLKDPSTCFQSLCRTIAGQFVSGSSAQAAWRRLLESTNDNLTPETIMALVSKRKKVDEGLLESRLQKPVGLTKTKAKSIVDLATHFTNGSLSEEFLKTTSDEHALRKALLKVKGVGPWSCDMFLIFYLELPDILPLGDLGVRKEIPFSSQLKGAERRARCVRRKTSNGSKRDYPFMDRTDR